MLLCWRGPWKLSALAQELLPLPPLPLLSGEEERAPHPDRGTALRHREGGGHGARGQQQVEARSQLADFEQEVEVRPHLVNKKWKQDHTY